MQAAKSPAEIVKLLRHEKNGHQKLNLNDARALLNAGKALLAVETLECLPGPQQQGFDYLSTFADALRLAGRWSEAGDTARKALPYKPDSVNMRLILAGALGHADQWDEAGPIFDSFGDFSAAIEIKAGALVDSGNHEAARSLLGEAIRKNPYDLRLQNARAMLEWMLGDKDHFADPLLKLGEMHKSEMQLQMLIADLLRRAGRDEDALDIISRTWDRAPAPELESAAGILMSNLGQHQEAAGLVQRAVRARPDISWIRVNAACALLSAGQAEAAIEHTKWGVNFDETDQEWIALNVVAQRCLGDESYRELYDYERFVRPYTLPTPKGFDTLEQFLDTLAKRLRELHQFNTHPLDQTLRGGSQLQLNPHLPQDPLIELLWESYKAPIKQYLEDIGHSDDHFFTRQNTGKAKMQGSWSVRLARGGSHVNHIHSEGWISSACYIVVPDEVRADNPSEEGWITFGEPKFKVPGITPEKKVAPRPGILVLFPSYMWHGVNPFHTGDERMTVPFDLQPG